MKKTSIILLMLISWWPIAATGTDPQRKVTYRTEGVPHTVEGRVVIRDQQGGLCLQDDQGELWLIEADEVVEESEAALPFEPATREELTLLLREELGEGFQVHETSHYLVAYSTSRRFAQWLSSLLERLHRAYVNYWDRRGIEIHEPEFPLIVVVYDSREAYQRASAGDLGGAGGNIIGYYSLKTNRVSMYDLTGVEAMRAKQGDRTSLRDINRMLSRPAALPLVSTIVHEATHQVAFNIGLTERFADLPLWYAEGMAIYFEAPDLSNGNRWRGIGKVNHARLKTFRQSIGGWDQQHLQELLTDDQLFRQPDTAVGAYADAWALTYYLLKHQSEAYQSYVTALSEKKPFEPDPAGRRLEEFKQHFGPLDPLLADFLRRMSRLR